MHQARIWARALLTKTPTDSDKKGGAASTLNKRAVVMRDPMLVNSGLEPFPFGDL